VCRPGGPWQRSRSTERLIGTYAFGRISTSINANALWLSPAKIALSLRGNPAWPRHRARAVARQHTGERRCAAPTRLRRDQALGCGSFSTASSRCKASSSARGPCQTARKIFVGRIIVARAENACPLRRHCNRLARVSSFALSSEDLCPRQEEPPPQLPRLAGRVWERGEKNFF